MQVVHFPASHPAVNPATKLCVAKKERDQEGYSLGRALSAEVSRRIVSKMEEMKITQTGLQKATGLQYSHINNLLRGTGNRLWQRHQLRAVCRALGMSELQVAGDVLFPELGAESARFLPPGLAEFLRKHEDELTVGEMRRLREGVAVVDPTETEYNEDFWRDMLRLQRAHRARGKASKK